MFNRYHRMVKHHPGTGPTHHLTHPLCHQGAVAMHPAQPAGALLIAKAATVEPPVGIGEQLLAVITQPAGRMLPPAIEAHDDFHRPLLLLYPRFAHSLLLLWQFGTRHSAATSPPGKVFRSSMSHSFQRVRAPVLPS